MIINHNIAALNTHRQLSTANTSQSKNMEKLSSGLRINRAGDDAAGLAISEKMRGQIRGLDQASRNAQDSISLIQTAEGALNETHSILQRMRELAVQSANDTNTNDDRAEIQKEIDQLTDEINRIAKNTEFNTKKLLNGDAGNKVLYGTNDNIASATVSNDGIKAGKYAVVLTQNAERATHTGSAITNPLGFTGTQQTVQINGENITFDVDANDATTISNFIDAVNKSNLGIEAELTAGNEIKLTTRGLGSAQRININASDAVAQKLGLTDGTNDVNKAGKDVAGTIGGKQAQGVGTTLTAIEGDPNGLKVTLTNDAALTETNIGDVAVIKNELTTHIGANKGQTMSINIGSMSAVDLGIDSLKLDSQSGAESAIETIDEAIKRVSAERSKLGAYQNRLEHTINNLSTSSENLTAAESRIRDVDMAKEIMEQSKNSILAQAAQAMLAQANQQPQGVLQLLQ